MLKRQQQGAAVSDPALVEATIQLLSATHPAAASQHLEFAAGRRS